MDQVIYLEPDEEITSVLDKLKNTEGKSIILVVPKGATLLQSLVNLKLLSKKAIELEKEIALVTTDKIGRNLASLVGFSVYSSIKDKSKIKPKEPSLPTPPGVVVKTYIPSMDRLEEPIKPEPEQVETSEPEIAVTSKKPTKPVIQMPKLPNVQIPSIKMPSVRLPSVPLAFWISLILGFAAVFAILYFILPKATVILGVKATNYNQSLELIVDQKTDQANLETRVIPGQLKELETEGAKKYPATGKKNIGGKASGNVTITNAFKNPDGSGSEIPLKSNVEVKDAKTGKIFLTNSSLTVPALTYSCDQKTGICQPKSGTATVKITASESGESYNIGPSDFSIPGLGMSSVSAKSSENMSGGYDKFVSVVSDADINKAKEDYTKELFNKAKDDLKAKLDKSQKLLEGAVKGEVLSTSSSADPDTQANDFEIKAKVKISTLVVNENEYRSLLSQFLEKTLPSDKRLVSGAIDSVELSLISYDSQNQIMRVKANVNTQVVPKINEERIKESIAKKSESEATAYLKSLNEIESVQVKLWPYWMKKLPSTDKIKMKIKP